MRRGAIVCFFSPLFHWNKEQTVDENFAGVNIDTLGSDTDVNCSEYVPQP